MSWANRWVERKLLRGRLEPGESIVAWSFCEPLGLSPIQALRMSQMNPVAIVTDRSLYLVIPRPLDVATLPFNLMDAVFSRHSGYLCMQVSNERMIEWNTKVSGFPDSAVAAFEAYERSAYDAWTEMGEPDNFLATIRADYGHYIGTLGMTLTDAHSLVSENVFEQIAAQSKNKSTARAALRRADTVYMELRPQHH